MEDSFIFSESRIQFQAIPSPSSNLSHLTISVTRFHHLSNGQVLASDPHHVSSAPFRLSAAFFRPVPLRKFIADVFCEYCADPTATYASGRCPVVVKDWADSVFTHLSRIPREGPEQPQFELRFRIRIDSREAGTGGAMELASYRRGEGEEEKKCAVCLDRFKDGKDTVLRMPACRHEFHGRCVRRWLGRSRPCPLCRRELAPSLYFLE